jgi:hypothetical protein
VALGFQNRRAGPATISLGRDVYQTGLQKRGVEHWEKAIIHGPVPPSLGSVVPQTLYRTEIVRPQFCLSRNLLLGLLMRLEGPSDRNLLAVCGVIPCQKSRPENRNRDVRSRMGSFVATEAILHPRKAHHLMVVLVLKTWFVDEV